MKKIKKELDKIYEQIQENLDDLEIQFNERSENWQESEHGQMSEQKIGELQEVIDNIEMTIDSIGTFIE